MFSQQECTETISAEDVRRPTLDPESWSGLRALGHRMLDDTFDWLASVRDRPVWQPMSDEAKAMLREPLPVDGEDRAVLVRDEDVLHEGQRKASAPDQAHSAHRVGAPLRDPRRAVDRPPRLGLSRTLRGGSERPRAPDRTVGQGSRQRNGPAGACGPARARCPAGCSRTETQRRAAAARSGCP